MTRYSYRRGQTLNLRPSLRSIFETKVKLRTCSACLDF